MKTDEFLLFVLDQLRELDRVRYRAMFGGFGLYRGEVFFAIVHRGRLYFRTGAASRERYRSRGMGPFRPSERQTIGSYWEVPADVLEDPAQLAVWAREAVAGEGH